MEEENKNLTVQTEQTKAIMEGDPENQLKFGYKCATALMQVVASKPKKVMINGEQYLEFEDWQTLGRFFGITVGVDSTKQIVINDINKGWEAKAIVYKDGKIISSAEAMCMRSEKNWANRDEFTLRSMAQTRACAKALRNVLAWVAVLGGFRPTPIEDMPDTVERQYVPNTHTQVEQVQNSSSGVVCQACGVAVSEKVASFSRGKWGTELCFNCQKGRAT